MEFTFRQKVSREDYVAFVDNHLKRSILKPLNLVLFVISIGYLMISPFILDNGDYTFFFIGLGIALLLAAMIFYARRNAAKQYDKTPDQFNMEYKVDDEGLTYLIGEGSIEKKWFDFHSAMEKEDYLYLYVNKNSGMVIVKREVPIDALNFIKEKIKEKVNPKNVKLLD